MQSLSNHTVNREFVTYLYKIEAPKFFLLVFFKLFFLSCWLQNMKLSICTFLKKLLFSNTRLGQTLSLGFSMNHPLVFILSHWLRTLSVINFYQWNTTKYIMYADVISMCTLGLVLLQHTFLKSMFGEAHTSMDYNPSGIPMWWLASPWLAKRKRLFWMF